jgi:hypothetical protein
LQLTPADAKAAAAFCNNRMAKQCGWAGQQEVSGTLNNQSPWGGTVWRGPLSPSPQEVSSEGRSYFQYAGQIVSLGCRPGKVVVRANLKPTQQRGDGCVRLIAAQVGSVARDVSNVTRCQLEMPPNVAPGDEFAASLKAREFNCRPCANCRCARGAARRGVPRLCSGRRAAGASRAPAAACGAPSQCALTHRAVCARCALLPAGTAATKSLDGGSATRSPPRLTAAAGWRATQVQPTSPSSRLCWCVRAAGTRSESLRLQAARVFAAAGNVLLSLPNSTPD